MAKPEWGTKRTCYSCGARFYDLRRDPAVCPVCAGAVVTDSEKQPRPRRAALAREEPHAAAQRGKVDLVEEPLDGELTEEDVELDDLEDQADADGEGQMETLADGERELIEDTSDLGEDDDDIGELMEHVNEEGEDKA